MDSEVPSAVTDRNGRGFLVALEGLDGAGTTTQTRHLARELARENIPYATTCEPSSGPIGSWIRDVLGRHSQTSEACLALLFAADRLHHIEQEIGPQLAQGKVVISDRYLASSLAYQGAVLDARWVADINRFAQPADLTIYLRVDLAEASRRRRTRTDVELFEGQERQRQVHATYETIFSEMGACAPNCGLDGETPWLRSDQRPLVACIDGLQAEQAITDQLTRLVLWLTKHPRLAR